MMQEFDHILKSLGHNLTEQQLMELMKGIDKDGNGLIDFSEFLQLLAPKIIEARSVRPYAEAFRLLNSAGDGILSKDDLLRANLISGAGLSPADIDTLLHFVQTKFDDQLTFPVALKMLLRSLPPTQHS